MPSRHHDNNGSSRLKSLARARSVPVICLVEHSGVSTLSFLFTMGVINDEQVSTFTSNSSTNTDSEVLATLVGTPSPSRFRVSPQRQLWENLFKIIIIDKVTNLSAETH